MTTTLIKRLALSASVMATAVAAAALPASAQAWRGHDFKSPSGNIVCHSAGTWLGCASLNNGNVVVVTTSTSYHSYHRTFGTIGYVLGYGQLFRTDNGNFVCLSDVRGMACKNRTNGRGFVINASGYRLF